MVLCVAWSAIGYAPSAFAQDEAAEVDPSEPVTEGPDPTRLDVERLPPEAIEITRDLYAHGFFLEGWVGGRGFVGGVGRFSAPGFFASVGMGFELFSFIMIRATFEASFHETNTPAPPSPTAFEIFGVTVEARLQANFNPYVAAFLQGEGGLMIVTGDVLRTFGFNDSESIGLMYGGSVGFDWHMKNRHHSLGLLGGARLYPNLDSFDGETAIGIHGAAYLRYVF
ncbi:MAG: hypothetical protein AAGF12_13430 [Myxococcota bacterium]